MIRQRLFVIAWLLWVNLHTHVVPAADPAYKPVNTFEALRLNSLSLQRFDVLISHTELADMEELGYVESKTLIRLVRDDLKRRALEVRFRTQSQIVLDQDGKSGASDSDRLQAKIIEDGLLKSHIWPGPISKRRSENFENTLLSTDILHLDFIGATHFPTREQYFNPSLKDARMAKEKMWLILKAAVASPKTTKVTKDEVVFSWEFPPVESYPFAAGSLIVCDRETLLPKSRSLWGGEGEQRKDLQTMSYLWKEVGGVVVPLEVRSKKRDYELAPDKSKIEFDKVSIFKFHWFSVNSELDGRMFDDKLLEHPQEARKLVDPRTAGATSLIE